MPPVGRSRRFTASSTRTASQKYEITKKGKPTLDPNMSSLLNIDDKCIETTSSVKDDKQICAVKSLMNCPNGSTIVVERRKNSAANLQNSDLKSHTGAMRLNHNARNVVGVVNSNIMKAKNKISKYSIDKKKKIRCTFNETTRHNSSTSNYEAVEPKNSSTMATLSDPNLQSCDTSSKIYTNIAYSSKTDHPNRPNSIEMKYGCDFKQIKLGVTDSPTSQKTETIECNNSFKRDENCIRKDAKKKDIPIIMNEKFVCQCNGSVINKFCGNSFQKSKFCCHVYIKKGECDSIGKSYNGTNFLDIIDTKQSYLFPGNIHSISASNLDEHISENLQNESKQVAIFDKAQDEEMKFVPETVIELTRNSTEDIVKNSADTFRRKYPFKQTSVTFEDAYVTPTKISNRRNTICFSSFSNVSACASVAAETTQSIAKEIAMTDVSNHPERIKQVETLKITCQDDDVSGYEIRNNFAPEANSDHKQQIIVPRNENKFLKITKSPSYISPENNLEKYCAPFSPENKNRQMMPELIEKVVTERGTRKTHGEIEFCTNSKDFKEEDEEYCVKMKTLNSIHALIQIESESHNETGEGDVNMKISYPPFSYNDVKRKKLSMPKLEVTERRQIKKKAVRDITELTLKFATSLEKEDECYEEVMSICDRSSVEPSFAVSSEVSEYLVRAVLHRNNVQSSEEPYANRKPAAPPRAQPVPNSSDQNQSQIPNNLCFYPVELGRIYYQFYDRVVYVLKGYIPLHKAYRISYKIIYDTFRRFPHSFNNFNHESLSLDMNIHNRRKLYSRYLLDAILKLPPDLPQFHFAHFLKLTTELLNRLRIPISIPVVVQHLLAVMLTCNMDYKQNETFDKFKKTLESFSDTFNNKNGTNRPEFGMTFTQRFLLKTQILTYLQLYKNQKICSESSKLLYPYYSRQQQYIQNANSNNIEQTFGTCRNENPTNETQHSIIQNSNQSNRSSEPMQYPNLRIILNNKSSDPPMQLVPNTRTIISSSSRQPPTCTSDRNNCSVMNVTIPMKYPIRTNSINSVTDKIEISENSPVNKMTNNQVSPISPKMNSSVEQSRIYAHSSSLQAVPLMTNADIPYTVKKERTPLNECNIDVINGKSFNEAKKYESSDNCVDSVGSTSLAVKIKEEIVEKFPFCEDEIIDDHTSLGVKIKEEINEKLPFYEGDIIDLTWIDDYEVPSSPEDSGMDIPTIQMEYPLLILENRLCLCGKTAIYLCHCNTVMYCSQQCQLTNWPKHRKGCHSSCAT